MNHQNTSPDVIAKTADLAFCLQPPAKAGIPNDKEKDKGGPHSQTVFHFIHHLIICSESICIFPSGAVAAFTRHYGAMGPEACRAQEASAALVLYSAAQQASMSASLAQIPACPGFESRTSPL